MISEHEMTLTPFVLRNREMIPEMGCSKAVYSYRHDMWVTTTGEALIDRQPLGETTLKETREGIDQPECAELVFGETEKTATAEGIDQPECMEMMEPDVWGETILTKTSEGVDQVEFMEYDS